MANISLGRAVLVLGTEIGAFVSDLDNAAAHTRKLQDAVDNVGKGLRTMGRQTTELGTALSLSITAPIAAIGGAAIKMGMDAVESENLFNVSFGGMADAAREWSTKVSDALGLNEFELRRTSGTLYTMFDAMGIGTQAAFDMSTSMVELGNDMASFFNLRPEEAFEKLRAGIVGEAEPLKALGILVDETTVKQTAMRHGLIKQGEEMTQQQKVLARYITIMEQTSKAQGDLARTADSPTNRLRTMKATLEETAVKLGVALLPAFEKAIGVISQLIPKIEAAANWFAQLSPNTQLVVAGLAALAAAIGPVLVVIGTLISSVGTIVSAFSAVVPIVTTVGSAIAALGAGPIIAIVAAIGAVVFAWRNWDEITAIVGRVYTAVKTFLVDRFTAIVDSVKGKIDAVTGFFSKMYDAVVGHSYVPDMLEGIKREFGKLEGHMVTPADKAAAKVAQKFAELEASLKAHTTSLVASTLGHRQFADALLREHPVMHALDLQLQKLTSSIQPLYTLLPGVTTYMYDWAAAHERAVQTLQAVNQQLNLMPRRTQTAAEEARAGMNGVGLGLSGLGKKVGDFLTNIPASMGSIQKSLTGTLTNLFGASPTSVLGSVVSGGLNFVFGPLGGLASQLLQQGMQKLGEIALAGLKKIGGFFKSMFGGPSADELAGRKVVTAFEANLAKMLTEQQRIEAGGEAWKATVVAIRDQYIAMGLTEAEALADAERLWKSSKEGAEEAKRVIEEIQQKFGAGIRVPVVVDVASSGGGVGVPVLPMAHGTPGIVNITRPTLFYSGGNESAWFSGEGSASRRPGGGGTAILEVAGRTLAEILVPELPGVVRRYALAR